MYRLNNYLSPPKEYPRLVDCIREISNASSSIEYISFDGEIFEICQGLDLNEFQFMAHLERSFYGQTEIKFHLTEAGAKC
jgi:hypothetical protein